MLQPHTKKILKAINNGNFLTWTGLNNTKLLKHLPPRITTALGNIDQEISNLQLKKPNTKIISPVKSELEIEEDTYFFQLWIMRKHTKYVRQ